MGRKKKPTLSVFKPICYYCEKEYPDTQKLINHQRAVHFKCPKCPKRLDNARGLVSHASVVHKEDILHVPNSLTTRSSVELAISGMQGVPTEFLLRKAAGSDLELLLLQNRVHEHPLFKDLRFNIDS